MKTSFLAFVFLAFAFVTAQAQKQPTTYMYVEEDDTWMKFRVTEQLTSPDTPFIELSISQKPDFWVELEILEKNPTYYIAKIAGSEVKMKLIFKEGGLLVSDVNDQEPRLFRPLAEEAK